MNVNQLIYKVKNIAIIYEEKNIGTFIVVLYKNLK